eukprot:8190738-Pyramimonas_sp.AAC.1
MERHNAAHGSDELPCTINLNHSPTCPTQSLKTTLEAGPSTNTGPRTTGQETPPQTALGSLRGLPSRGGKRKARGRDNEPSSQQ